MTEFRDRVLGRFSLRALRGEEGMLTAEYAMTTVAACGAAGVLYKVLTSDSFTNLIGELFKRALAALF